MLEHLNELEIRDFVTHETRFDFVKLILARSHVLKKVTIFPDYRYGDEKKFQISKILLGYSRASPEVQIIVEDPCNWYCWSSSVVRKTPMWLLNLSTSMWILISVLDINSVLSLLIYILVWQLWCALMSSDWLVMYVQLVNMYSVLEFLV